MARMAAPPSDESCTATPRLPRHPLTETPLCIEHSLAIIPTIPRRTVKCGGTFLLRFIGSFSPRLRRSCATQQLCEERGVCPLPCVCSREPRLEARGSNVSSAGADLPQQRSQELEKRAGSVVMAGNGNDDAIGVDEPTTRDGGGRRSTAGSASSAQAHAASSRRAHLKAMQAKARRRYGSIARRESTRNVCRCIFIFLDVRSAVTYSSHQRKKCRSRTRCPLLFPRETLLIRGRYRQGQWFLTSEG